MTVPFLEVILHTTNEVSKQPRAAHFGFDKRVDVVRVKSAKEQEEDEPMSYTLVRLIGRLMLPIGSLIFTLVFWVVGLLDSYSSGAIQDPSMTDCLTIDLN